MQKSEAQVASAGELAFAKTIMALPEVDSSANVKRVSVARDGEPNASKTSSRARFGVTVWSLIDAAVAGRRLRCAATGIVVLGAAGPIADYLVGTPRPFWTVTSTNALLLLLWLLFHAWLGSMRDTSGASRGHIVLRRLRTLGGDLIAGYAEFATGGSAIRAAIAAGHLGFFGCALVLYQGVATTWAVAWGRPLPSYDSSLAGALLLVFGVALLMRAKRGMRKASSAEAELATKALERLPTVIDRVREGGRRFAAEDPLKATLQALTEWRPRADRRYDDAFAYVVALERHFRRHVPNYVCRREIQIRGHAAGQSARLLVGGLVLVHVVRGFSLQQAEHILESVRAYPKKWRARPKLLLIFDAEQRAVFDDEAVTLLQRLKEECATITVRM